MAGPISRYCFTFGTVSVLLTCANEQAQAAEGMRFVGNGPLQQATAGAGAASPRDSTWLTINPAALTAIEPRLDVSIDFLWAETDFTPQGGLANPTAETLDDDLFIVAPQISATYNFENIDGTFSSALFSVGGEGLSYDTARSGPGFLGGYDTKAEYVIYRWANGYAAELDDGLSLGLSLNLNYARFRSDSITAALTPTSGNYAWDDAWGAGFSLGLYKTTELGHAFSLTYHSRQWMERHESYNDLLEGPLDQPPVIQLGTSWNLHPAIELLIDYRLIQWSSVRVLSSGFGWEDQNIYKAGLRIAASDDLELHTGISYSESQIPDSHVFSNGLSPLVSEVHIGIGADYQVTDAIDIALAVIHSPETKLTDNGAQLGGIFAGSEIKLTATEVIIGMGYRF